MRPFLSLFRRFRPLLLAAFLLPGAAHAEPFELQTAVRETWPFFDLSQTPISGVCPLLMRAIEAEEPGVRFVGLERKLSFPLMEAALINGKLSVMCGAGRTPERDKYVVDAGIVGLGKLALGVRSADTVAITDLKSLAKASQDNPLLVRKGTIWVKELRAEGVNVIDDATENEVMARMVAKGRARYFYSIDYIIARAIASEHLDAEMQVIHPSLGSESLHLLLARELPEEVRTKVTKAFARIKARGEFARILAPYKISDH